MDTGDGATLGANFLNFAPAELSGFGHSSIAMQ
jgi:hypothetical protein